MNMTKEVKKIIFISCAVAVSFFLIGYAVSSITGNTNKTGISDNPSNISGNDITANNSNVPVTNLTPTNQTKAKDRESPTDYPFETAISNGDYVNQHGQIYNDDVMTDFINKVSEKKQAFIRTVVYTVESDPIITDFSFNAMYFSVTKDTTRDRHDTGEIVNRSFDNLVIYEDVNLDRYVDGKRTYYIVTNISEVTAETFMGIDGEVLKYE